eukprot:TRINITY_DN15776_c0_g1_i2.p1 TRINITY_DN15776_c0_g1~~TRINITY_DN15776_c0_g1_i2.p1  ORF type:complete len:589 (+),score=156.71 TRINITY_DN15776_c0_g1_i2:57-1769(+)
MGGVESTEGGIQGVDGLQVGSLLPRSPAHQAGLIPFFDYIVKVDSHEQKEGSADAFREYLRKNKGNNVKLTVYNSKVMALREVTLSPDNTWGGNGLLGCSLEWGNTTMSWHVSAVSEGSPAKGILSSDAEDYIIGAEKDPISKKPVITLFCDDSDFHSRISEKMNLRLAGQAPDQLLLLVYNVKDNTIREEYIALGNSTTLGIDVGNGYLHNIPPGKSLPVMKRFISLDATVSKVRTESIVMNESSPSQTPSATPKAVQQPLPASVPSPVQPSQQLQQQLLQQHRQVGEDHFNTLLKQKEDQLLQRDRENEEMRKKLLAQQQEQENQLRLIEMLKQQQLQSQGQVPSAHPSLLHADPQPMSQQEIAAARVSELMGTPLPQSTLPAQNVEVPQSVDSEVVRQLQEEKQSAERLLREQEEAARLRQQQEEIEKQRLEAERQRQQQQLEAEQLMQQQKQQQLEAERILQAQQQQQLEAERLQQQQQQQAIEAERLRLQEEAAEAQRVRLAELQQQAQLRAQEEAEALRKQQAEAEATRQREIEAAQQMAAQHAEAEARREPQFSFSLTSRLFW